MNILITPEVEKSVQQEVKTGQYRSASEVIRAALRRLKEDKERKLRFMVSTKEEPQEKLLEGTEQLDRGEGIPGEQVLAELKTRSAQPAVLASGAFARSPNIWSSTLNFPTTPASKLSASFTARKICKSSSATELGGPTSPRLMVGLAALGRSSSGSSAN